MFGKQTKPIDFGSFVNQTANSLKDEYKSMYSGFKQNMADKSLTKRQNIIKENAIQYQAEHEKWLADRADGMPRDWGAALKDAGGGSGAAFRVGANAVAGGVVGGVIDGSMGNDSWSDGAMTGAVLGGALGAGSFAHSVNKLKVGKYTPVVNGGVSYTSNTTTGISKPSIVGPRQNGIAGMKATSAGTI